MTKLFVANYSKGEWDDYHEKQVFVSHDEQKVQDWVEKFNQKLERWKEYYSRFEEDENPECPECRKWIKEEFIEQHFYRWIELRDTNGAFLTQIELR